MPRSLRTCTDYVLLLVVLIGLVWYASHLVDRLEDIRPQLNAGLLVYAVALASLASLLGAHFWYRLASGAALSLPWLQTVEIWTQSRLARYLPGKIAPYLLRWHRYGYGAGLGVAVASANEFILSCLCIALFFAAAYPFFPFSHPLLGAALTTLVLAGFALSFLPNLRRLVETLLSRRLGRVHLAELKRASLLKAIGVYFLSLLVYAGMIHVTLNSTGASALSLLPYLSAMYFVAGLAGVLAPFAPAGIGVREGVALVAFLQVLDPNTAVAAVILLRLVSVAGELTLLVGVTVARIATRKCATNIGSR